MRGVVKVSKKKINKGFRLTRWPHKPDELVLVVVCGGLLTEGRGGQGGVDALSLADELHRPPGANLAAGADQAPAREDNELDNAYLML